MGEDRSRMSVCLTGRGSFGVWGGVGGGGGGGVEVTAAEVAWRLGSLNSLAFLARNKGTRFFVTFLSLSILLLPQFVSLLSSRWIRLSTFMSSFCQVPLSSGDVA